MVWFKDFIEAMFGLGLFVNAVLFIPQIIKLLRVKNAEGLSLLTFGGFSVIQFFIILHGLLRGDYLLFLGYLISFITCGTVTGLIIFYRFKSK